MKAMFRSALFLSLIVLAGGRFAAEARQTSELVVQRNGAGQVTERFTVVNGTRQGQYESFYDNGARRGEGVYVNGGFHGRFVVFFENGKIRQDVNFVNGQLVGPWTEYFATGQVRFQGEAYASEPYYHNDAGRPLRTGVWTSWFENGQKQSVGAYDANLMTGKWVEYFETGKVLREVHFEKGKLVGPWTQFHPNGQVHLQGNAYDSEAYYHNDTRRPLKTGVWTTWFENGQKQSVGAYSKNNRSGRWIEYGSNGNVMRDVHFVDAVLKGMWSEFHANGKPRLQGEAYGSEPYYGNDLRRPLKTGVWIMFSQDGNIEDATIYVENKPVGKAAWASDSASGLTSIRYTKPDGTSAVVRADKNGWVTTPESGQPAQDESTPGALLSSSVEGNQVTTVRRNADGTKSTYRGTRSMGPGNTERLLETDEAGRRIETLIAPDGTVTVTSSVPGKGETHTLTPPDGRMVTTHRDVAGNTETTRLHESGSLISERRDREGKLIETVTHLPDGWRERADRDGNLRREFESKDGSTTTIAVDRSGNTTTIVRDPKGAIVNRETHLIAPREPGRDYFENVLGGDDWDNLPQSYKNRYANSERAERELMVNRAREDAAAAQRKAEDAKRAAEANRLALVLHQEWENFESERAAAEKKAAALEVVRQRKNAIDNAYEKGNELQRQFNAAITRGDREEALRIRELQDRHSEQLSTLLLNSPEEAAAIKGHSDARSRLAREITAKAYENAAAKIASDEKVQGAKEAVTGVTRFVSIGSAMQQETRATTRGADRERALAEAKLQEIERRLNDPAISAADKDILRDMQAMADAQKTGADMMLLDNARLTAIGYGLDAVTTLTGTKAAMAGGTLVRKTLGAVGSTLGKRTATQATTGIAGKATISVVDDAANAVSATSVAGRRTLVDGELTRIVGTDVLASPAAPQVAIEFTRSELRRLFTPGANLTGAEIVKKAELLRRINAARTGVEEAFRTGAAESVIAPLRAEYLRLKALIP